ncbi:HNH endonuclease signature motif containing protein [Tomitella biformata]|uniref:HNH endonuclease signature motif containing protein n=1 Tax=Tomitella biformata TaxID=630403 RepID=UPI0034E2105F
MNLRAALQPFMDSRPEFDGSPDRRSPSRVRADALSELVRRHTPAAAAATATPDSTDGSAPDADAEAPGSSSPADVPSPDAAAAQRGAAVQPRISIYIPIEMLFGDIPTHAEAIEMIKDGRIKDVFERTGRGWMSHLNSISMAAAQRLACDCELTMIGADMHGAPLTVDTAKRFASKKHRIALEGRDKGCAFPNCDRPADWTQAHHMIPWETRHETQIDGLCLLCTAHHVAVHHQGWEVALGATRYPVFRPPTKIDPLRRWRDSNGNFTDDPPTPETFFAEGA